MFGNHTNNYAKITVRLYKDSSLQMQGIECDGPGRNHMYCDGKILRT